MLHVTLAISGQRMGAGEGMTVIAQGSGVPEPIGSYNTGDIPAAGDKCVVRLRLEALVDVSNQSPSAAVAGDAGTNYIRWRTGTGVLAKSGLIADRGDRQAVDQPVRNSSIGQKMQLYHQMAASRRIGVMREAPGHSFRTNASYEKATVFHVYAE